MKLILSYMKPRRAWVLLGAAVKFCATIVLLLIPFTVEHVIDDVVPAGSAVRLLLWGAVMIALAVLERFLNLWSSRVAVKLAREGAFAMRENLFARSMELSQGQADEFGLPSLTARLTSDIYNIQGFMQLMTTFCVRAPTLVLGSLLLTLLMDPGLALILCIVAPVMVTAVAVVSWKGIPLFDSVQRKTDAATRILRENIVGVRVVKALGKEDFEIHRFDAANEKLTRSERLAGDVMSLPGPVSTLFLNLGLVAIVLIGAERVNTGVTQPGVILAFLTFFNMILMGVMGLNRIFMMLSKANASADRVAAVLSRQPELTARKGTESARQEECLRFDDVSFHYGGGDAQGRELSLAHVSFSVKRGGSLGIIGPTGSGKSTIVNLLMRFYDPDSGRVYIDGRDAQTWEPDELRRRFGAVFQSDVVFADSLAGNISFGRDISQEQIRRAAADAMAAEFIEGYEEAYQHRVAARGADLSGGQRQRLLIARALAGEPEILILDDASSALDYRTDAALRRNLRQNRAGLTCVIVAQRVSAIMDCDEILMLDEGRVIGRGRHEDLLRTCPQYAEIYKMQMGEVM